MAEAVVDLGTVTQLDRADPVAADVLLLKVAAQMDTLDLTTVVTLIWVDEVYLEKDFQEDRVLDLIDKAKTRTKPVAAAVPAALDGVLKMTVMKVVMAQAVQDLQMIY